MSAWIFQADRPIYSQIVERLGSEIAAGKFNPGDRMYSVRELAADAGVNPNTMQRALSELESMGLLVTMRGGAGRYVSEDEDNVRCMRRKLLNEKTGTYIANMRGLGLSDEEIKEAIDSCLKGDE